MNEMGSGVSAAASPDEPPPFGERSNGAHPPDEPRFKGFGDSRVKCTDALMSPTAESHAVQIDPTERHAHSKFLFHTDQGALIQPGAL